MKKALYLLIVILLITIPNFIVAQNRALDFDGADRYVNLPNTLYNDNFSGGTAITIELWFKGSVFQSAVRFQENEDYVVFGWDRTNPRFIVSTDNDEQLVIGTNAQLEDGEWHHIAVTWEKNTINGKKAYVDGVLTNELNTADVNLPLLIDYPGLLATYHGYTEKMIGAIDEVRIWNNVRTETEINDNMHRELSNPTSETNLVVYFKLNETTGTTAVNAHDNNSYNGTLENLTFDDQSVAGAIPIYVDKDVTGGDGASWATAYSSLQDALDIAVSGNVIWVAEGTYKPSVDETGAVNADTRLHTFQMINGVEIYGGFAGTETSVTDRQIGSHETILSGDIGTPDVNTDNCYHVFYHPTGYTLTSSAILDGFTITKGNADFDSHNNGGGMYNNGTSPTITNCLITGNSAVSYGGAFYNAGSGSPSITNCLITSNSANSGGGLINYNGCTTNIKNSTIVNNNADFGSGIYNSLNSASSTLINCIVWDNTIYNSSGSVTITYSNIEGGHTGTGNIDANPLFVGATLNASHPYSIFGISPCVGAGTNTGVTETYDIRGIGFDRTQDGTTDMGAYEYTSGTDPVRPTEIYVNGTVSSSGTGISWSEAYKTLQEALDVAANGNEIWVATGTYKPSTMVGGTTDRDKAFQMKNGVKIYGGFDNTGNQTATSQRTDYGVTGANETILSGDIDGIGDADCYHVFHHDRYYGVIDNTSKLDGFTIKDGKAEGSSGGGFYDYNYDRVTREYTIENCTFTSNSSSTSYGGGLNMVYVSAEIINCTFSNCSSKIGAGISVSSFNSTASFTNCTFTGNSSTNDGGAIYLTGTPTIFTNCLIADNQAGGNSTAGGICLNGGSAVLNNLTIVNNSSGFRGGGIYAYNSSTLTINNCIIWGNTSVNGNNIFNSSSTITSSYSDIDEDGYTGNNNIRLDPLFADVYNDNYLLTSLSPCADDGNNSVDVNNEAYDIRGANYGRKLLKTNYLTTGTIDMGAYEYNSNTDPVYNIPNWTGALGTDFTVAGNWDGGVPTENTNARIPDVTTNDPVIGATQTADCNNLTVESGASLTLQSIADGSTGSLIINGTLSNSGTITSQRYFPGPTQGWHMVSAPVTGIGIAANGFAPETGDFYAWDEPSPGTWVNHKTSIGQSPTFSGVNGSDNFVAAKGYLLAFNEASPTHDFVGNLNVGNQSFTLKNSGGSSREDYVYTEGWNLMGNPYSSAIDWSLVDHSDNSLFLDDFAYAYDPTAGNDAGGFVNITGVIAANQGFFVHAKTTSNEQVFAFTNAMQTHGGTYYKNKAEADKLILRFSGEQYYDEAIVRMREESTFNKDRVDAFKMNSFNINAPNIYTISNDNINLAINSIPEIDAENNIRIGIVAPKDGLYTISVIEASNYMMDHNVYLEDLLLNSLHKISESDYSFTSDKGDIADRFVIHFGVLGVDEPTTQPKLIQIWASNHTINIHNTNNYMGDIKVVNMYGQTVLKTKLDGIQSQQFRVNAPSGYYIINTITKKGVVNKKVYLR